MSLEIRVPPLGESLVEATLAHWLKKEGDPVSAGEAVAELETDKVAVQVSAERDGVLTQLRHHEGDTVNVGDVLALLEEDGARAREGAAAPAAETEAAASEGNGRTEGDAAEARAPEAPVSPMARKLAAESSVDLSAVRGTGPGGRVTREDVEHHIEHTAEVYTTPSMEPPPAEAAPPSAEKPAAPASPPARPASAQPARARPTPAQPAQPAPETPAAPAAQPVAAAPEARPEERVRMSRRRQTIAARLVEAQQTAAMLTTFNEVDMSAVMDLRRRRRDAFKERHGVGLGFMSFFTKAAIGALKAFPHLNAEIQGDEIVVKRYYDIGIAVSTDEGLVVPVVRDADRKTFAEIEREIADLAARARDRKLTLPEIQGGTFTLTNGGVFGSLLSTPILNTPQVGILGLHKIEERPIALEGEVVIRPMMYLALSYDHRIVDGSEAVRFLVRVKELIEDPEALLIEG